MEKYPVIPSRQPYNFQEGALLLIDKPLEWTSFDVVNKVRNTIRKQYQIKKIKVGHSGTLDPLATGLLIICTGKFTKRLNLLQDLPKSYEGIMHLGAITPSYDRETEIIESFPIDALDLDLFRETSSQFVGDIEQLPPMFSAVKVDGTPLYKLARKGLSKKVEPRKVRIDSFELSNYKAPYLSFQVHCSKGTYIRSLAHDFGQALHNGAFLHSLHRTSIGPYHVGQAWNLAELIDYVERDGE